MDLEGWYGLGQKKKCDHLKEQSAQKARTQKPSPACVHLPKTSSNHRHPYTHHALSQPPFHPHNNLSFSQSANSYPVIKELVLHSPFLGRLPWLPTSFWCPFLLTSPFPRKHLFTFQVSASMSPPPGSLSWCPSGARGLGQASSCLPWMSLLGA